MKLSIKGMAIACGLFWGVLIVFEVGMLNLAWPSYGREFLQVVASIYPGYHATPSFGQVIVGTLYALVDGAVGGTIFAWLYNRFATS
jgi:hypothetical protein